MRWKRADLRWQLPIIWLVGVIASLFLVLEWLPSDPGIRQSAGVLYMMPGSASGSDAAGEVGEVVVLDPNRTSSEWLDNVRFGQETQELYTVEWVQERQSMGGKTFPLAYRERGEFQVNRLGSHAQPSQQLSVALRHEYVTWLRATDRPEISRRAAAGEYRRTHILWPNVARHLFLGVGALLWIISLWLLPAHVRENRRFRRAAQIQAGTCPACGYRFGVNNPQRCSECGEEVGEAAGDASTQ